VASTSVALSGLTITPSVPPEAVSGGWTYGGMGVDASPRLRRPRGHLARVGVGLSLQPSPTLPCSLPFPRSQEGGLGGGLGETYQRQRLPIGKMDDPNPPHCMYDTRSHR
jgi:hypothetical protein